MSLATTTTFLFIGLDKARRDTPRQEWPVSQGGFLEMLDWLETAAMQLERLYDAEFAQLELSVVFDYDITEELGAWLYRNELDGFEEEARRMVRKFVEPPVVDLGEPIVEIRPCMDFEPGEVVQCTESDADYFGVYVGGPGNLMWQADFEHYTDAVAYANGIAGTMPIRDTVLIERNSK